MVNCRDDDIEAERQRRAALGPAGKIGEAIRRGLTFAAAAVLAVVLIVTGRR